MKLVSIVGDSISTYDGYNPRNYSVFYDKTQAQKYGLNNVYDTWWAKVNQKLNLFLCVNDSFSGSRVTGTIFPAGLSDERIHNLKTERYLPDYILVYLGFNDFINGIPITSNKNSFGFEESYEIMLMKIKKNYPQAKVVCGTLMRTKIQSNSDWRFPENYGGVPFEEYNTAIRRVVQNNNCYLADLDGSNERYETLDGSHPTAKGHMVLAENWIQCLCQSGAYGVSVETCIKMYHSNKDNDLNTYMVFDTLIEEKLLIPIAENGNILSLSYDNQLIIPLFTSPNEAGNDVSLLKTMYIRDNIELLISLKKNIVVNPFSEPNKQFIIPYPAIEKKIIPLIQKNERSYHKWL